jgi:hypothetical protein
MAAFVAYRPDGSGKPRERRRRCVAGTGQDDQADRGGTRTRMAPTSTMQPRLARRPMPPLDLDLTQAVVAQDLVAAGVALRAGADPNAKDPLGYPPLWLAAAAGRRLGRLGWC